MLLPLLQTVWNHHPFERVRQQGESPLSWACVEAASTLTELFDHLFGKDQSILVSEWLF